MTDKTIWFVTGAGHGMGVDIAKAALDSGHAVVATGRKTDVVARALGQADELLVVKLDVTRPEDAKAGRRQVLSTRSCRHPLGAPGCDGGLIPGACAHLLYTSRLLSHTRRVDVWEIRPEGAQA